MRKFLQTLQPSSGGKENLVGAGRIGHDATTDGKAARPEQAEVEVDVDDAKESELPPTVDPSLYKKLIIEDLTSTASPSEKYWEVIAERRRKALQEVIEENHRLKCVIGALEEESKSCKKLLEETTDLVNTLKEVLNGDDPCSEDDDDLNNSSRSTPDSCSSDGHVNKKMKISQPDSCSSSESEC